MNPGGENQTESDKTLENEAEKAYREAAMEWVLWNTRMSTIEDEQGQFKL